MEKNFSQQRHNNHIENILWLKERNIEITFDYLEQKYRKKTKETTCCTILKDKEKIAVGFATKHPSDNNNRIIARTVAFLDATSKLEPNFKKDIRSHSPIKMKSH